MGNAGWRSNTEEPSIPSSNSVEKTGLRSEHISADGVSDDSNIPAIDTIYKGMLPLLPVERPPRFLRAKHGRLCPCRTTASAPSLRMNIPSLRMLRAM